MAWATNGAFGDGDRRAAFVRAADLFCGGPELPAALQSLAELGALVADVCIVQDLEEKGRGAHVAVGLAGASPALGAMIGDRLQASASGLVADRPRGMRLVAERDYAELAGDAGTTLRELGVTSGLLLPIGLPGRRRAIVALFCRDDSSLPDAELVSLLAERAEQCFVAPMGLEEGDLLLSPQPAGRLVDDVFRRMRPLARERGLVLSRRMKYRGLVLCDRERTLAVLAGLVGNSVRLLETGRVTVGVDRDGPCARFLVENTGPGIPAGRVARLFESSWPDEPDESFSGAGLQRVRALVEAQGGVLSVETEAGHGSRFRFTLRIP